MATLDIFNDDAFSLQSLTAAIMETPTYRVALAHWAFSVMKASTPPISASRKTARLWPWFPLLIVAHQAWL